MLFSEMIRCANPRHFLVALIPFCFFLELGVLATMVSSYLAGNSDFRHLYVAGYMVRNGQAVNLYDIPTETRLQKDLVSDSTHVVAFIRPPFAALLFAPLGRFSYRTAYFVWLAVNLVLLAVALALFRATRLEMAITCAFVPVALALLDGQDSIFLLLVVVLSYALLAREREFLAGCVLALGLFKFNLILPIALCFLLWKRWRVLHGFSLGGTVVGLLSLLLVGWSGCLAFVNSLMGVSVRAVSVDYATQANLHSLWFGLFGVGRITVCLTVLSAGAVLLVAWRAQPKAADALIIAIPAAVLVSYYANVHDWLLLLLPMFWCFRSMPWRGWVALVMFVAPAVALFSWPHAYLVTLPMLAVCAACLSWRRTRAPRAELVPPYPQLQSTPVTAVTR